VENFSSLPGARLNTDFDPGSSNYTLNLVPRVRPYNVQMNQIHADWIDFDKKNANPSWNQVFAFANFIDQKYSQFYWPD